MITDLATSGGPAAGFGRATFGALGQLRRLAAMVLGRSERAVDRRSALIAFAVRVTSAAILLVSQVALARWMGVEQFGIYISAWTLVLVLGGIATVGLNVGAIRIVSELREQDAPDALRGFLHAVPLVVGAVAAAVALAATAGIWLLAGWPPSGPMLAVAVILAAVPAFAMTELQDGICRGAGRFASGLLAPYIVRPLLILGGIGALLAAGAHLDAAAAALVAVAATWVAWALQLTMMRRDLGTVVPPGARAYDRMREWSATAAPLARRSKRTAPSMAD